MRVHSRVSGTTNELVAVLVAEVLARLAEQRRGVAEPRGQLARLELVGLDRHGAGRARGHLQRLERGQARSSRRRWPAPRP